MQIRTFSISVHDDGAQGEVMNRFLRGHQVLRVHREFLPGGNSSACWCFCVEYEEAAGSASTNRGRYERICDMAHLSKSSIGLEPRDPRRQLEQQRAELPLGEPQQEQPVQPQQQHRFAGRLRAPSSEVGTEASAEPDGFLAPLRQCIVGSASSLYSRLANALLTPSSFTFSSPHPVLP